MRGQKRVEDARERAYAPRIHLLRKKVLQRWMDCIATRACPSCAFLCAASPAMTGFLPGTNGCGAGHVRSAAETPYILTQHLGRRSGLVLLFPGTGVPWSVGSPPFSPQMSRVTRG